MGGIALNTAYWVAEYASSFIEAIACFIFCGTFINREKVSAKKHVIVLLSVISAAVATIFNTITFFSGITAILGVAVLLVSQYIAYRHPIKCLIYTIVFFAVVTTIDLCVVYSIAYVSGLTVADIALEHTPPRLMAVAFAKMLIIIFVFTTYRLTVKNPIVPKKYIITMFGGSLFAFVFSGYFILRNVQSNIEEITIYSVLFAIMFLILIIGAFGGSIKLAEHYENKQHTSLLALRNQMLEESNKETEKTFSLWQSSLHDHKHNLLYLMSLAESGDTDGIKTYIEKESNLLTQRLFYYKTGNDAIDTIINVKQTLARERDIPFLINAAVPNECRVSDSHLCAVLGNLIDNAINASIDIQEPYIEVNIKRIEDFLVIKVVNRFSEVCQNARKSKESQTFHGIGLKSVRRIIKGYDGEFSTTAENELFIAKVIIQL
jgi:sensor histidine kinase YesM